MPYTDRLAALARTKERCQAASLDDAYLLELLDMSAGKDAIAAVHYRPFFVAAKFLEQNPDLRDLSEADGAKFTLADPRIKSLYELQRNYDLANNLSIPKGFESPVFVNGVQMIRTGAAIAGTSSVETGRVL